MRITSWNILHGMAIPPSATPTSLAEAAAKIAEELAPDLVGVQECDYLLERSGNAHQIAEIATSIGAPYFAFAPSVIGTPGEKWRKLQASDQRIITNADSATQYEGSYGIGIVSKVEVLQWHRLDLGNAPFGAPLLIAGDESGPGKPRMLYIRDEPRLAIAATLANGYTVISAHLSFVPGYNLRQLNKIKRWAQELEIATGTMAIITGDFNLPMNLPVVGSNWKSLASYSTYPSWGAKIQFDYILSKEALASKPLPTLMPGVSDHLPISAEILSSLD
jgi:endonuclease/exonuclease/phosphatase family metal-dependent hydrolase